MRPSIRRFLLTLALLAVPAVAAAGCGGGSSSKATGLSAAEWRQQADAICADIDTRQNAIAAPASAADVQKYLETILPLGKEQASRLKALAPPAELQSLQTQALANQEEAVSVVEQAIARIKGGEDPATVINGLTADVDRITGKGKELAQQAGLTKCGAGEGDGTTSTDTTAASTASTESTSTPSIPTTGDAQVDQFLADVQKATGALTAFGTALSAAGNPDDIKAKADELRGQLADFDEAITAMGDYTLDNATVEGQRSRLVAAGPKVSEVLGKFIDAAGSGDIATIGTILPEVATALQDFTAAAQP